VPLIFCPAAVLLLLLALPAASQPPAARLAQGRTRATASVALLPAVGPASGDDRHDLDDALRQGLLEADEIDLLSPVETRQQLMSLAEMGLVCLPEDVPCLVKLGLVSNVVWVLVPVVEKPAGRDIKIHIGVVDVAAAKLLRTVDGSMSLDDSAALAALAVGAMGLGPSTPSPTGPGDLPGDGARPDEGSSGANGAGAGSTAPAPAPGLIVAGIGGMVAGLSLVGATVCDLVYLNVIAADKDTRKNLQPVGAVLWGTTVLALVAVGAGVYLMAEAPAPP
jgi:hypothetical protein